MSDASWLAVTDALMVLEDVVTLADVKAALDEAIFKLELVLLGNSPKSPSVNPVSLVTTPAARAFWNSASSVQLSLDPALEKSPP